MSDSPPRVSVILIFLDEERFLAEAIASVQAQTFADWELILVDDGSTDRSGHVARTAAAADDRITRVSHPDGANRGMSASRNLGLSASRGAFVAFLDGDDVWVAEKLADQVAVLDANPEAEMVYGRTLIWHEWRESAQEKDFCHDLGVEPDRSYPPGELVPVLLGSRAQSPTSINAIMRRTLLERTGAFEDHFRGMFEDQAFFAKALLVATCYVDGRVWARYRQHESSCTARVMGTHEEIVTRRTFLDWLAEYVRVRGLDDRRVRRALRRARLALARRALRWRLRHLLGRA